MIKTISAFITACFMVISSFGVAADEKAPVSDKDREMREQVPAKLDGGQDKKQQKMDDKYRDKAGPALKKDREIRRAEVPISSRHGQGLG
ncbi:hypothetical protein [Nitrosospira sp. NRS527]|uniref:hypothetical protein n=1 Tax=Nitrosospira sp. NRS527 TaxID=155925 RepID=UPI001AFB7AAC|nr:hypothetical protein [Nitrosospira sp. NRS527]BCT68701.1 hypothetical protein NNRS527_02305 [Nitrosospira sp. NRS527]